MADEKIITSSVFEQGITEIMQDIANNLYEFEEYTEEEVANLIDLSEEEATELTRVINDTTVALNKVYSNKKVEDLLSELEVTCNKYADEKIGGVASIHLAYVDSLPSLGEDNTIYILKSTTGGNDTLNLYNNGWISIGEFAISLDNYYDKAEVDALLNDKANANEVIGQDDVVSDMSAVSSSTVLSTAGLEVELNKKVNKDSIVTVLDDTVTDEQVSSAKAVVDELGLKANASEVVKKTDIATTIDLSSTDKQVASALLIKTELDKTNAKLGDKADKTELDKRREIRVGEIYDSNGYHRVDVIGHYARPLYFRVVSTNGGEEILSFGQSVTSERKVIGTSVKATFKYIPPTSNASNGTLFIKTNKADISLTIFYTQIYSVASIPTLRDSTAEEYATGTDFNVQELATKTYVTDKINEAKDNVDNHTHNIADVNELQFALDRKALKDHKHSYNDLNDKPAIPTKVSELENDRGYLTSIPKEYITESELKTKVLRVFYDEREINEAHGTNISLVVGEDNTEKIINVLEPHEEFINWFGNTASTARFGIDESMGVRLNVVSIQKCTNNEGFAYAITSNGKIFSRFFQDGVLSEWNYDSTNLPEMNTKISQLETKVSDLFQSVSDGKTLVANAITGKGVSTATNATFATMATNISKITTTYKEETKSYNNTSTGATRVVFTFSADVYGVKQVTPPSDASCYIVPETTTNMFTIDGKEVILYVNGTGTWKVTAFIKQ